MTLFSMTGFAREEWSDETGRWVWEIKSVNGRGFEYRNRLPPGMDSWEAKIREVIAKKCRRGSVTVSLWHHSDTQSGAIEIDAEALNRLAEFYDRVSKLMPIAPPRLESLMTGGLLGSSTNDPIHWREERQQLVFTHLTFAVDRWTQARATEGQKLGQVLADLLVNLSGRVRDADTIASRQPTLIKDRLKRQLDELLNRAGGLDTDRLHQEVALLATKADIREELDRLHAHIEAARELMGRTDSAIGRPFDFLCQEFNREANTLCSKATDLGLTRIGLQIKALVDQIREQVQNIE